MTCDVIIPAYNCTATIDYTLASIAMQQLPKEDSFRVTIVDDCSTDGDDYEAIAEYWGMMMPVDIIHKRINEGCGQARQTGMDETCGDFIMFVDADDCLISPYAIRNLMYAMEDNDMVMGQFVEEAVGGVVMHDLNFTWCHGKMYRRSFIKENELRFNKTRGNEDAGFNSLISKLTDKIKYIPQIVYSWNNNTESTVRKDSTGYRCGYGWRDFLENIAWSAEEQMRRGVAGEVTRDFVVEMIGRFYFQYSESYVRLPDEREANEAKLREFYRRVVRPFVKMGQIDYAMMQKSYYKNAPVDCGLAIPQFTYKEFLKKLGFIKDVSK